MHKPDERGIVFHWPRAYDLLLRLIWGRREDCYRAHILQLAAIAPGEAVLDVGCGTGTLAIGAKNLAGCAGLVAGVDASPQMISRAKGKAAQAGADVDFVEGTAQALPFADRSFDIVMSTTVIHCLPEAQRGHCFAEMGRVLKPRGRLLLVDFGGAPESKRGVFGHMHVHRRFQLAGERQRIAEAGFAHRAGGAIEIPDLHYILAAKATDERSQAHATAG
jgi:ubiquinone/menaquinone biosynthesis C-methylase UbiE